MSKELQQTKDEMSEIKSTLEKQLTEMQEELSALKSILHTKDVLINS